MEPVTTTGTMEPRGYHVTDLFVGRVVSKSTERNYTVSYTESVFKYMSVKPDWDARVCDKDRAYARRTKHHFSYACVSRNVLRDSLMLL